ncbi:hypothetical protein [Actinomycetospora sp. NBRC 106378]|uniref:hypothetical protein n=1 Tax=Actinomycetospora sp. NBRC 106378 TaxID=3032208 RepID=UPI0024A4117A|nr:hypothetical protein [Actinomycetospora sp. NBRC 106378]GLZ55663.1 hypothetical protein Acsp07_52800 [Actinomycetospora sp. NBRC 106378]
MTSAPHPAPLFDLVTGFPPDDALDLTFPLPLSLAVHMTMLESTGHAADVAALRRILFDGAREIARHLQAGIAAVTAPDVPGSARLRITHIVEERVPHTNGLRPHVHVFVGSTARDDGRIHPVDLDAVAVLAATDVLPAARERLVAATTAGCGLVWGPTSWSPCEVLEPPWLAERAAEARDETPCPGPWPRRQRFLDWAG